MNLKWLGHAAFLITGDDGLRVITDPYSPERAGYGPFTEEADLVIMSSDNDVYHCRGDLIPGQPTVINTLDIALNGGTRTERDLRISAITAMEALDHREHDPDQNAMYRFEIDGVHVGHMGDIGNALTDEQTQFFAGIDVLLALAGGHPTLPLPDLKALIDAVQPRIVVPMHFRTLRYRPRNTFWIETFLAYFDQEQVDFACNTQIDIHPHTLPAETRVVVLTHAC